MAYFLRCQIFLRCYFAVTNSKSNFHSKGGTNEFEKRQLVEAAARSEDRHLITSVGRRRLAVENGPPSSSQNVLFPFICFSGLKKSQVYDRERRSDFFQRSSFSSSFSFGLRFTQLPCLLSQGPCDQLFLGLRRSFWLVAVPPLGTYISSMFPSTFDFILVI